MINYLPSLDVAPWRGAEELGWKPEPYALQLNSLTSLK
jgi:hypothetical protein